ncbi:MAG: dienelactone hydrolase family protein [Armatimonadetes bacterium]|nr:dienelactone hydrolase family protein [Armatimonadota bacterium]
MNGTMVNFESNGTSYQGYLALPKSGSGPAVIVIQEWWGLVGHIKDVVDRYAAEGFVAFAPDFYHGKATDEPDEAGSLMMALNIADAEQVIRGAVSMLVAHESGPSDKVGVVGFCMGGQLSMFAACLDQRIGASINYYGIHPHVQPDFAACKAPIMGFFAEHDDYASASAVAALESQLKAAGVSYSFTTYPGTHHAFFNSDRPEVYDHEAAEDTYRKAVVFFREHLEQA